MLGVRRLDCSEQIVSRSREKFPSEYQRGLAPLRSRSLESGLVLVRVLREGPTCVMVGRRAFGAFIPVRLMPEGRVLRGRDGPLPGGGRKPARRAPVYHFGSCALLQRDKGPDMRPLLPSEHMGKTLAMKAGSGFHGDTGAAIHSLPFGPAVTRQLHSWIYEEISDLCSGDGHQSPKGGGLVGRCRLARRNRPS